MGWFARQESALKLGDDPVRLLRAWVKRDHWKKFPPAMLSQIIANSQNGILDRPLEGIGATRVLIFLAEEQRLVQTNFLRILNEEGEGKSTESIEAVLGYFAMTLSQFGRDCARRSLNAASDEDRMYFALRADMAFNGAIVCDPFEFTAYLGVLTLCCSLSGNRTEALEWCTRFRRAEAMLLRIPESEMGLVRRVKKESLCPEVKSAEMRQWIEKKVSAAAAADDRSIKEVIEDVERQLLAEA